MSKQRAYQLAKELGCEITHEEGDSILLDAIPPMKLAGTDGHCLVYSLQDGMKDRTTGRTIWQYIIEDLKYGVERCETTGCEICAGL
jgi:hypothetical protein